MADWSETGNYQQAHLEAHEYRAAEEGEIESVDLFQGQVSPRLRPPDGRDQSHVSDV